MPLQIIISSLATFAAVFLAFRLVVWWDRRKEDKARKESLSQIKHSLKSELETNLELLRKEKFKVWWRKSEVESRVILVRPLKLSAFELVAGREDLKYLGEALSKVACAYDQIQDFNNVLNSWISRALFGEEKGQEKVLLPFNGEGAIKGGIREIDLSFPTTEQLNVEKQKTIDKVNEALEALKD